MDDIPPSAQPEPTGKEKGKDAVENPPPQSSKDATSPTAGEKQSKPPEADVRENRAKRAFFDKKPVHAASRIAKMEVFMQQRQKKGKDGDKNAGEGLDEGGRRGSVGEVGRRKSGPEVREVSRRHSGVEGDARKWRAVDVREDRPDMQDEEILGMCDDLTGTKGPTEEPGDLEHASSQQGRTKTAGEAESLLTPRDVRGRSQESSQKELARQFTQLSPLMSNAGPNQRSIPKEPGWQLTQAGHAAVGLAPTARRSVGTGFTQISPKSSPATHISGREEREFDSRSMPPPPRPSQASKRDDILPPHYQIGTAKVHTRDPSGKFTGKLPMLPSRSTPTRQGPNTLKSGETIVLDDGDEAAPRSLGLMDDSDIMLLDHEHVGEAQEHTQQNRARASSQVSVRGSYPPGSMQSLRQTAESPSPSQPRKRNRTDEGPVRNTRPRVQSTVPSSREGSVLQMRETDAQLGIQPLQQFAHDFKALQNKAKHLEAQLSVEKDISARLREKKAAAEAEVRLLNERMKGVEEMQEAVRAYKVYMDGLAVDFDRLRGWKDENVREKRMAEEEIRKAVEERKAARALVEGFGGKLAEMEARIKEVGNTGIEKAIKLSSEKKQLSEELEKLRCSLEKAQKEKDELKKELENVHNDKDEQNKMNLMITKLLKDLQKAVEENAFDPEELRSILKGYKIDGVYGLVQRCKEDVESFRHNQDAVVAAVGNATTNVKKFFREGLDNRTEAILENIGSCLVAVKELQGPQREVLRVLEAQKQAVLSALEAHQTSLKGSQTSSQNEVIAALQAQKEEILAALESCQSVIYSENKALHGRFDGANEDQKTLLQNAEAQLKSLADKVEALKGENRDVVSSLKARVAAGGEQAEVKELAELKVELEKAKGKVKQFGVKLGEERDRNSAKQLECEQANFKIKELEEEIVQWKTKNHELVVEIHLTKGERDNVSSMLKTVQKDLAKTSERADYLQAIVDQQKNKLAEVDAEKAQIEGKLKKEVEALKTRMHEMREKHLEEKLGLNNVVAEKVQGIQRLENDVENLQSKKKALEEVVESEKAASLLARQDVHRMESAVAVLNARVTNAEKERDACRDAERLQSEELRDLQSKYDSAKLRFEYEKEASIEAINKFKIELGAEKKKVELLQGKLEVAATKIADVEDMMKTIIGYCRLEKDLDSLPNFALKITTFRTAAIQKYNEIMKIAEQHQRHMMEKYEVWEAEVLRATKLQEEMDLLGKRYLDVNRKRASLRKAAASGTFGQDGGFDGLKTAYDAAWKEFQEAASRKWLVELGVDCELANPCYEGIPTLHTSEYNTVGPSRQESELTDPGQYDHPRTGPLVKIGKPIVRPSGVGMVRSQTSAGGGVLTGLDGTPVPSVKTEETLRIQQQYNRENTGVSSTGRGRTGSRKGREPAVATAAGKRPRRSLDKNEQKQWENGRQE